MNRFGGPPVRNQGTTANTSAARPRGTVQHYPASWVQGVARGARPDRPKFQPALHRDSQAVSNGRWAIREYL
jgi:hypothetical protein